MNVQQPILSSLQAGHTVPSHKDSKLYWELKKQLVEVKALIPNLLLRSRHLSLCQLG